jgi:ferrous iron transport protein B
MGSRASPNLLERIKLVILTPFIPCQARLVVLLAIATAIGGFAGAILVPLAYFVAFSVFIVLSYIASVVSKRRGVYEEAELLLELPPLHRPYARVVWWFTWFYLKHFLVKAGTVIFSVSIISWILLHISLSTGYTEDVGGSIAAQISRFLAPLLSPLGISGERAWIAMYAVIMGFLAKELVVSAIVTATSSISFEEAFQKLGLSIPSAIAFTLFITLYIPCLATLATIYSESKSFKYVLLSVIVMISTAYLVALLSYLVALML